MIEQNHELDVDRLLSIVDPYNNEQITFSQCVTLLSSVGQRHQHSCDYLGDDPNWRGPGFSLAVAFIMRLNDTALQLLISADYQIPLPPFSLVLFSLNSLESCFELKLNSLDRNAFCNGRTDSVQDAEDYHQEALQERNQLQKSSKGY